MDMHLSIQMTTIPIKNNLGSAIKNVSYIQVEVPMGLSEKEATLERGTFTGFFT